MSLACFCVYHCYTFPVLIWLAHVSWMVRATSRTSLTGSSCQANHCHPLPPILQVMLHLCNFPDRPWMMFLFDGCKYCNYGTVYWLRDCLRIIASRDWNNIWSWQLWKSLLKLKVDKLILDGTNYVSLAWFCFVEQNCDVWEDVPTACGCLNSTMCVWQLL